MIFPQTMKVGVWKVEGNTVTVQTFEQPGKSSSFMELTVSDEAAAEFEKKIGQVVEIENV